MNLAHQACKRLFAIVQKTAHHVPCTLVRLNAAPGKQHAAALNRNRAHAGAGAVIKNKIAARTGLPVGMRLIKRSAAHRAIGIGGKMLFTTHNNLLVTQRSLVGVQGSRFKIQVQGPRFNQGSSRSRFKVQGSRFKTQGKVSKVQGQGSRSKQKPRILEQVQR